MKIYAQEYEEDPGMLDEIEKGISVDDQDLRNDLIDIYSDLYEVIKATDEEFTKNVVEIARRVIRNVINTMPKKNN